VYAVHGKLRRIGIALAFATLAGICIVAYAPGLNGAFVFDSVERLVRNQQVQISSLGPEQLLGAAYAGQTSYPQRGLAHVTFALNYFASGGRFDPFAFKLTNLLIHVLNGLLVLVLARLVIARWWRLRPLSGGAQSQNTVLVLALAAAALWLLHPIQLTSVLYVIQRMTSLSATCVLGGAILFLLSRIRLEQGRSHAFLLMYGSVIACSAIGFLFKQNALLLPAFAALLEFFLFERRPLAPSSQQKLRVYFGLTLVLPILAGIAILASGAGLTSGSYAFREFDMLQRVFTQARVLFFYLSLLAMPITARFGLFHDDISASSGIVEPWTTLVALVAWLVVVIVIVHGARRRAPWSFALAWFLVGHALESSVLPLELVHEHRNYVPSVGIAVAVGYYAGAAWYAARRLRVLVPVVVAVWLVASALTTHTRADAWRSPAQLMATLARFHPESYRSASGYAFNSVAADADIGLRFDAFHRAAELDGRAVSAWIEMHKIATALAYYLAKKEPGTSDPGADSQGTGGIALRAEREDNERLLAMLDAEIVRRLEHELPRTDNVVALVGLVDCSLEGAGVCIALRDHAARWHSAALDNRYLPAHLRATLELSLARLHALAGNDDEAVRHARLAARAQPAILSYRLQEATLYALLERWIELGEVLSDIETRFPIRAKADATYRDLLARHANRTR